MGEIHPYTITFRSTYPKDMPDEAESAAICEAIADGTFPQSEQLLTSELSAETIPLLLERISKTRSEISEEIKATSKDDAGDVDQWIAQAKKVQEDIARCKEESKRIVEEHQHVQALRDEATDYERKVELLEAEIGFTETLRKELDSANAATEALREVEDCLLKGDPCAAAAKIQELDKKTKNTLKSRTSTILRDLRDELRLKARVQLETKLNLQISIHRDQDEACISVRPDELDGSATNSGVLLRALDQLGDSHDSLEPLKDKLKAFVLQPLRQSSRLRMTTYEVGDSSIRIQLGREGSSTETALDFVLAFLKFLQSSVASTIRLAAAKAIMSDLMTLLVNDWLNPGLPTDLTMLDGLDDLQARVIRLLKELESLQWEGQKQLQDWIEDIPRAWLNKRKAATLDAVRKAFVASKGTLRQVERVERQTMPNVDSDVKAMEKFARLAYSKEMETQRLIVWDLLEGAQGFTSCTQFPYSQEIENAVSAVVDRIRALHITWRPILSTSALMQSIGSLVTMVIGKVIDSIEEMEDISEPESRRLTAFCQQIASLDDLFLSSPPSAEEQKHDPVPMTAVYVTNWLKFQYLINILESSLVDIKYLWTEGELSLEFSADEVVDLIRALFAESAHRRSAIASIKGGRSSR